MVVRSGRARRTQAVGLVAALALSLAAGQAAAQTANAQYEGENGGPAPALKATVTYGGDALYDLAGGLGAGAMYDGRLGLILDSDLDAAFGWSGASGHLSLHAIHGTGVSGDRVGNLLTVSGLEAEPALRLFNLWIEQRLGAAATVRVGQFTAAQEFAISPTANLFVNATFGWPASFAADLPSGGPSYPLAAPGLRLSWAPSDRTSLLAAVFAGDPAGKGGGDPQARDRSGLNSFRLQGRPFVIVEWGRRLGASPTSPSLKLGAWLHFDRFDDLRIDDLGRPLTDPASSGRPRQHRGDAALYAILDGQLWAAPSGPRALHGFLRASASPSDRNAIDRYLDAGLSLTAPMLQRPKDVLGLALGTAHLAPAAGFGASRESVVELTYQLPLNAAVSLQPDLQYVRRPNGGRPAPDGAAPPRDAVVAGVRTMMRF
jgi:porin